MQQPDQFDSLRAGLVSINHDELRVADDQFTRALHAAWTAYFRLVDQLAYLIVYAVTLLNGRARVVLGNVINLCVTVRNSPWEPFEPQAFVPSVRLTSAARFLAQLDLATSCGTHFVFGSSAS